MIDIHVFDGTVRTVPLQELKKHARKTLWIDCVGITKEESELLQELFKLHPLTAEDLVNDGVRVKIEEFPTHLFSVFYGLQKNANLIEIDFILGKKFLITSHKIELNTTTTLKNDQEKLKKLFKRGPDFLMHRILDAEVDYCFEVMEDFGEKTDELEEAAADHPNKALLTKIYGVKRQLTVLKRTFLAQREKTGMLAKNEYSYISKAAIPYFRDVYDHSIRVSDAVEGYREATSNAFDVYMSAVSNSMNEVMKVLSIIATIALPLTVISGIYGTNFATLPGQNVVMGFWYMLLGMFLLAVVMLLFFKRKKWF